ncbi:MAG: NAD(P)/FAD-dependent oxidoreductase [Candidatus Aenigmatarchaeota archaeon]
MAGAGPSGLSAAINLVKAGFEVEVFEAGKDCGSRFGGDLQGLENWSKKENVLDDLKQMNIEINFDCAPFKKMYGMTGKNKTALEFSKPAFYLVKRGTVGGSLDQGLKRQAMENGVKIIFNSRIGNEADIIATGPFSKESFAVDRGIIFDTDMDDIAVGLADDKFAYKGYAYFLVTNGYGCICTVLFDKLERVNDSLDRTIKFFEKNFNVDIKNPRRVGGVGTFSLGNKFEVDGKKYVGEAAGIQDLLWGFGMRSAITSGYLAAKSIIDKTSYQDVARKYFEKRLKASLVNRFVAETFLQKLAPLNAVFSPKDHDKMLEAFGRSYTNYPKILYPLALWSLSRRYKSLRN